MKNDMDISLKNKDWKEFSIISLFSIERGKRLVISKRIKGNIPLVTAGYKNEGVADFIQNKEQKTYKNSITIDMFGNTFYREYEFKSDDNIHILLSDKLNKHIGNFISRVINQSTNNIFSYGKQFRIKTINKQKILLPINSQRKPDYEFMENYMRAKEQEKIKVYKNYISKRIKELENTKPVVSLKEKNWAEFFLNDIFSEIQRGKRLKKGDHKLGKMPYVSSTIINNGIDGFISNKENVRIFFNCLSLANSGSVGACFYHPYKYVASDHVTKLKNNDYNKYIYLFLSAIVTRLGEKYSFNREINDTRIKKEKVLLPINENKEPDYEYMENYIKRLELEKIKKYLNYKETK